MWSPSELAGVFIRGVPIIVLYIILLIMFHFNLHYDFSIVGKYKEGVILSSHAIMHPAPAEWLKLSRCRLGYYLEGRTKFLLEVVFPLVKLSPVPLCSDGDTVL